MGEPDLALTPLTYEHAAALQRLAMCPEVARNVFAMPAFPHDGATCYIAYYLRQRGTTDAERFAAFAIQVEGEATGACTLRAAGAGGTRGGEIAFWLARAYRGRGIAERAVAELVRLCFEVRGLDAVAATILSDNEPASRLVLRLGFELDDYLRLPGTAHHARRWSLTRRRWQETLS